MNPLMHYAQDLSTNGFTMLVADLVQYFPERQHILKYANMSWKDDNLPLYLMDKGLDLVGTCMSTGCTCLPGLIEYRKVFPGLPHTAFYRFSKKHVPKKSLTIGLLHGDVRKYKGEAITNDILEKLKDDKSLYFYTSDYKVEDFPMKVCGFNPYTLLNNLKHIDILIYPVPKPYFSGRIIQEALSINIPVICPEISLLTEQFDHKKHLLFYKTVQDIVNFVDLLKDHDYRNTLASSGRLIASRLSLRNQHDKFRQLFN